MSLLKTEPTGSVTSIEELFAIACAMEREAADRYAEIADRMRREGNPTLAEVFASLSADERGHLDSVVEWSQTTNGQNPDPAQIRWELPETFDDEGAFTSNPRLLSAYRALAMAVRNEERAFAFWSYVAAHAGSPDIRQAAEVMAHEELGHVATLRRERRKAFHAERDQLKDGRETVGIGQGLAALEWRLAELLEALADEAPAQESIRLNGFVAEARHHAEELERDPIETLGTTTLGDPPDDAVALAELLTDRYLEAADQMRDEEALRRMQALAARAVARLAWLRADLPELQKPWS